MDERDRELLERVSAQLAAALAALDRFGPLIERYERMVPEGVTAWASRRRNKH